MLLSPLAAISFSIILHGSCVFLRTAAVIETDNDCRSTEPAQTRFEGPGTCHVQTGGNLIRCGRRKPVVSGIQGVWMAKGRLFFTRRGRLMELRGNEPVHCDHGLPAGRIRRVLPDGDVCTDHGDRYGELPAPRHTAYRPFPEYRALAALCRTSPPVAGTRDNRWLPVIHLSVSQTEIQTWKRGDGGLAKNTTVFVQLTFNLSGKPSTPTPTHSGTRRRQICSMAASLNEHLSSFTEPQIRMRGKLQFLAWKGELEADLQESRLSTHGR